MDQTLQEIADEIARAINGRVIKNKATLGFSSSISLPESYSAMGKFKDRAVMVNLGLWGEHSIQFDCNINDQFTIKKKSWLSKFNIFSMRTIRIRDNELDKLFDVHCNNKRYIQTWLLDTRVRDLLLQIAPFNILYFNGSVLRYDIDQPVSKVNSQDFIKKIHVLRDVVETLEKLVSQDSEDN